MREGPVENPIENEGSYSDLSAQELNTSTYINVLIENRLLNRIY